MGNFCGKISREILVGNSCGKIVLGKSCGKRRRGKNQFKKGSDWWKFSIWNRVDGEPTNEDLAQENLVGKSCGKLLRENLAGNSCRKISREILVGKSCGKWRRGKSQFKKGSDWWKFSIWNRVMGSQPMRI